LVFLIHGNHQASPNDPMRGLMPLIVSVPVGLLVWAACLALLGAPGTWGLLGFMSGYVIYDLVHYTCHQWPMRGRIGGLFKRHHMRHHYVNEGGNFAISALFWDRVFGSRIRSLKREEG
ncbi:MAG: sterol desaturase family protein, partial [Novosphingobium sp.]|nr:sterol desaturase family protein [Novosphingobium sp.]